MIQTWTIPDTSMIHARAIFIKIYTVLGARKLVKCLRGIVTLAEELGSVPITYMVAYAIYNSSSRVSNTF